MKLSTIGSILALVFAGTIAFLFGIHGNPQLGNTATSTLVATATPVDQGIILLSHRTISRRTSALLLGALRVNVLHLSTPLHLKLNNSLRDIHYLVTVIQTHRIMKKTISFHLSWAVTLRANRIFGRRVTTRQ
jgi:hypothetical protein